MPESLKRKTVKGPGRVPIARRPARVAPEAVQAQPGKAVQTRQKILDSAAAILAAQGFTATNLNDIAKAAGMKSGSLYFHFSSKEELITEVMHEGMARTHQAVDEAVRAVGEKADSRERICAAIHTHVALLHSMASYAAALIRIIEEVTPEMRASFRTDEGRYSTFWRKLIQDAQADDLLDPDANPRHVRSVLFAGMNVTTRFGGSAETAAQRAGLVIKLFGLGKRIRRKPSPSSPRPVT